MVANLAMIQDFIHPEGEVRLRPQNLVFGYLKKCCAYSKLSFVGL